MKWISTFLALGCIASASAATIAVIDSGLDYKHEVIVPNLWTNAHETFDRRDNDGNGYQDDVHGWNFAEKNGQIIDYKYLGIFSPDCKRFFDIQGKMFLGKATDAEISWLKERLKDKKFIAELSKFGNFIHGTHVSGITVSDSKNQVMGIKLIPTEVKPFFEGLSQKGINIDRWSLLETALKTLAREQMKMLTEIAQFVASHKMDIANGSFGTGFNQAKIITDNAFRIIFFKKPSVEESNKAARMFISAMVEEGKNFVGAAPETLFVFAAGNDGLSNDEYGTSPANIKAANVITVGATYKNEFFAPFSNYGVKMVDIAAPGMLINSAIPGNDYLEVSGTSQASPYVANIAAKIKEVNPGLKPVDIKSIIMGTVDKKLYLADKVSSGGIVNSERAMMAAQMSVKMGISEAISRSITMVRDVPVMKTQSFVGSVVPMPLTPMFQ